MTEDSPRTAAWRFLKTEAFYLAIALFVIGVNVQQNVRYHFQPPEERVSATSPVDQITLMRHHREVVERMQSGHDARVALPLWIDRTEFVLVILGVALALLYILTSFINMRLPGMEIPVRPVWNLWDCFKLAACWAAGRMALGLIFTTRGARPMNSTGFWWAEIFSAVLLIGVMAHIVMAERGVRIQNLGIHKRHIGKALTFGVAGFLILQPVYWFILAVQTAVLTHYQRQMPLQDAMDTLMRTRSTAVLAIGAFTVVFVAPVAEELFFRGFVQPVLQRWFGAWSGLFVCAAFFSPDAQGPLRHARPDGPRPDAGLRLLPNQVHHRADHGARAVQRNVHSGAAEPSTHYSDSFAIARTGSCLLTLKRN